MSTGCCAGALPFSRYNRILRKLMRVVARQEGLVVDEKDQEFTDWSQVDRFAGEVWEQVNLWRRSPGRPRR